MAQGVVSDNWSLQDITNLFSNGFQQDQANEIIINNGKHYYQSIPSAIIQTEALFDFISDLILRDEILVEDKFTNSWENVDSPILEAKKLGVIRAYPFLSEPEKLVEPRDRIIQHICSTESLRISHKENVDGWNANEQTPDPLLSATLWGGAGMCARSFVYEKGYTPHPLRKRLFLNSGFMLPANDALHQITTFINDQKVKVIKKIYGNDSLFSSYVNIPALPIRVIQEANHPDQFITIALQMRDDFQSLRDWLKMFQNAMSADDTKKLLEYRRQLDSISQYVDQRIGSRGQNKPVTMEAGIGVFKIATQSSPIENIKNQFGVRATINKLVFGNSGSAELKKYISMFGERDSAIDYEIQRSFMEGVE